MQLLIRPLSHQIRSVTKIPTKNMRGNTTEILLNQRQLIFTIDTKSIKPISTIKGRINKEEDIGQKGSCC